MPSPANTVATPEPGTRVSFKYVPVTGFPPSSGTGVVRSVYTDYLGVVHVLVHPDDHPFSHPSWCINLHPSECKPAPTHEQPALDIDGGSL